MPRTKRKYDPVIVILVGLIITVGACAASIYFILASTQHTSTRGIADKIVATGEFEGGSFEVIQTTNGKFARWYRVWPLDSDIYATAMIEQGPHTVRNTLETDKFALLITSVGVNTVNQVIQFSHDGTDSRTDAIHFPYVRAYPGGYEAFLTDLQPIVDLMEQLYPKVNVMLYEK